LTQAQAAYLAGFVDGEGSILMHGRGTGVALRLSVANTNLAVLEWCRSMTGVGNIVSRVRVNARHKAVHQWMVNSQAAQSVLEQIEPFLIIKTEQARLAIAFQSKLKIPAEKAAKEWQEQWRQRLGAMNARGPVAEG
jgi:hypothetical protein